MRLKNIILSRLAHERLVAYEKLERIMNKDGEVDEKQEKIIEILENLVKLNSMIAEWEAITAPQNLPDNLKNLQSQIKQKEDE